MLSFIEILKAILFGIVEGITEWLPVSSTGHMILLNEFVHMNVSEEFWDMFLVVIQLGAILAVVLLFWKQIWPFNFTGRSKTNGIVKKDIMKMWFKIIVACIPAAVVGLLFDDILEKYLYNPITVAVMLILFGIGFILVENGHKGKRARVRSLAQLTYKDAVIIGLFQLIAAIFPGTSRSGATILGGLMIGVSRTVAAEFTFFLAIPVMFGWGVLKLIKYLMAVGLVMTATEIAVLVMGIVTAFVVSVISIKFLMGYIKKNDFTAFGVYRIIVGLVVLAYFGVKVLL